MMKRAGSKPAKITTVGYAGERRIIEEIRKRVGRPGGEIRVGIGDDCLVLADGTVVTIDSFVDGVHFQLRSVDYDDLGHRLMAAALSDLAAMAARPLVSLVALMLPARIRTRNIDAFYRGAGRLARLCRCPIGGGDIDRSSVFAVSIAALGRTKHPKLRSQARPGTYVYLTGYPGLAETGRLAMKSGLDRRLYADSIARHTRPMPRIGEARRLAAVIQAMIDTSDGISTDAGHLAAESRVRIVIERGAVPIHPEVARLCARKGWDSLRFVLGAGEDFELLFTSAEPCLRGLKRLPVTRIGHVEPGQGVYLRSGTNVKRLRSSGYEHFRTK